LPARKETLASGKDFGRETRRRCLRRTGMGKIVVSERYVRHSRLFSDEGGFRHEMLLRRRITTLPQISRSPQRLAPRTARVEKCHIVQPGCDVIRCRDFLGDFGGAARAGSFPAHPSDPSEPRVFPRMRLARSLESRQNMHVWRSLQIAEGTRRGALRRSAAWQRGAQTFHLAVPKPGDSFMQEANRLLP